MDEINCMRVFLLDSKTGAYFQSPDGWTTDPALARDFISSHRAEVYAEEHGLNELDIYLDFGNEEYNVRLPVGGHS